MLGAFHILPFLKGWGYATYNIPLTTITRGTAPIEKIRIDEEGLLLSLDLLTNDAYATLKIDMQGADLQPIIATISPEAARTMGLWQQSPSGYNARYFRPLQASTAGIYDVEIISGYQGTFLPYYRSIVGYVYLDALSTQQSAQIQSTATVIRFTDKQAFIRTYRKFMGIKETEIDPELLEVGPR